MPTDSTNPYRRPVPELTPGRELSPWAQKLQTQELLGMLPNGRGPQTTPIDALSEIRKINQANDPNYHNLNQDRAFMESNPNFGADALINRQVDSQIAARSPEGYAKLKGYAAENPELYRQGRMKATIKGPDGQDQTYEATTGRRLQHGVAEKFLDRFVAEEQRSRQDKLLAEQRAHELQTAKLPYDAQSGMFDKQLAAEDRRYQRELPDRELDRQGRRQQVERQGRELTGAPLEYEQREQDRTAQFGATVLPELIKRAQASGDPKLMAAVTAIMAQMPGAKGLPGCE